MNSEITALIKAFEAYYKPTEKEQAALIEKIKKESALLKSDASKPWKLARFTLDELLKLKNRFQG